MKIIPMSQTSVTPSALKAIKRIRRNLVKCQFACLTDQVVVMLLTDETDPAALRKMAEEQMDIALGSSPDFNCYSTIDGHNLVMLSNGLICAFGKGRDEPGSLRHRLMLRSMALAACEKGQMLAIVTGDDADTVDMAPVPPEA